MTTPIRSLVLAAAVVCLFPLTADAGGLKKSKEPMSCPWWRPCGPGNTFGGNRFIPQGAFGVDARPACQRHDNCYEDPNTGRKVCDLNFYNELRCACAQSTHPWLCKRAAKLAYYGVRLFGSSSKTN
jgi:hypothetical protein